MRQNPCSRSAEYAIDDLDATGDFDRVKFDEVKTYHEATLLKFLGILVT